MGDESEGTPLDAPVSKHPKRDSDSETILQPHASGSIPGSAPDQIGQYHIKRCIATGGMGIVYEAVQKQPRRTVAVKVMKQGLASKSILRRFQYEAQILARLRHPGIAQIFEAGTHREGDAEVPYFVMEYIPNARSINEYARARELTVHQRFELFIDVCHAVHHGHQKGIIHRDLKPANILVDSTGQVKIIDFGVARATDSDLAITTIQTDVGQLLGTVQYMSPEQIEADPHDIDIRSDVYSLGVVLYELLTEKLPYDVSSVSMLEATRLVLNQEPPRLSMINSALRGDVETIIRTAMEKDRERRYQSAKGLANDINAYLHHDPISARPPSMAYQLTTFARKHKPVFIGVALVMLALAVGMAVTTFAMLNAQEAKELAEQRKREAEQDRERLIETRREEEDLLQEKVFALAAAVEARDESEVVTSFMEQMLSAVDPREHGRDVTVRQMLDIASRNIDRRMADQPLIQARLHLVIGKSYATLGEYDAAEPHLVQAEVIRREMLGEKHADTHAAMAELAALSLNLGRYDRAEVLFSKVYEMRRQRYGPVAEPTLRSANNLVNLYWKMGRHADGLDLMAHTARQSERLLGMENPGTMMAFANLAALHLELEQYQPAEELFRAVLEALLKTQRSDHPDVLNLKSNLGTLYDRMEQYQQAESMLRDVHDGWQRVANERDPRTLRAMNNLATVLHHLNRNDQSAEMLQNVASVQEEILPAYHPDLLSTRLNLSTVLDALDRHEEAERILRDLLDIRRRQYANDTLAIAHVQVMLSLCLIHQGRYADAEPPTRECLAIRTGELPEGHRLLAVTQGVLGATLAGQQDFEQAEPLLLESHAQLKDMPNASSTSKREALQRLVNLYERWEREDEAEKYRTLLQGNL